jgi:hypothetical protein
MEQKILDLLQKAGCKPELVTAIGESFVSYKETIREQFEADYTAKVEQAKKVCIEETEAHKRELARRLQVFLETKGAAIEATIARQSALSESAATSKLKSLRALLEGVELNAPANNGQATAVIEKAKHKIQQLTEERDQAITAANQKNAIAEKVLKRNRELVTENARLKNLHGDEPTRPVSEGRGAPRSQAQRIDGGRKSGQATTTRSTLVENQVRRPAAADGEGNVRTAGNRNGFGVTDIASQMDEDLI